MLRIQAGEREYELVEGWGANEHGWDWGQVGAVAVDSEDNVHIFTRHEHPYRVFDKSGKLIDAWGEQIFMDAHGMCITPDDTIYFVDRLPELVLKFDKQGKHRLTLGKRDQASDTGFTKEERVAAGPLASGGGMPVHSGVGHAGPPFYWPTDVSVAPSGEIYVSDGYRNCSVHKFAADGTLIKSWGEVGHAGELKDTKDQPNHFHTVHGIWEHRGKVYVSDRENNRIQIFTPEGQFLDMWTGFERPTKLFVNPKEPDVMYVSDRENNRIQIFTPEGQFLDMWTGFERPTKLFVNPKEPDVMYVSELEDKVSIMDLNGNRIGRFGAERSHDPGKFWGPHGIWTDSEGSIYVAEVLEGKRLQKFARRK